MNGDEMMVQQIATLQAGQVELQRQVHEARKAAIALEDELHCMTRSRDFWKTLAMRVRRAAIGRAGHE